MLIDLSWASSHLEGNTYSRLDPREVLLHKADRIEDPFEQSFFRMVHLPYLQPFADINKRTSRLAANLPLFRANLCPLTFLDVPEPDPLRLAWRDFIRQTIREVITQPELEPLACIQQVVAERVPEGEQAGVQALIVEELRRLHEGVLARYGLRPSEYTVWRAARARTNSPAYGCGACAHATHIDDPG